MRVITRKRLTHNETPVFAYGIDADSYEEAYTRAKEMFNEDSQAYLLEQLAAVIEPPAPPANEPDIDYDSLLSYFLAP